MVAHKQLIQWTLDAVRDSTLITDAVVTSDDPEVLYIARQSTYIFSVDERPVELATDTTSTEEVIEHVMRTYADDIMVLLQPTSPIRAGWQIDEAIRLLQDTGADSVVSVVPSHALLWRGDVPLYDPKRRPRRQEMADQYEESGSVYCFTVQCWEQHHCRIGGKVELYVMPEKCGMQIDTPYDLWLAEMSLRRPEGVRG